MHEQADEEAVTSGDGEVSEVIGEIVSGGDEVDAPRDEGANEGNSVMAAASSSGEADELIGEMAGSAVNEMGDAMATASGGGEVSAPEVKKKKKSKWTVKQKSHDQKRTERRAREGGDGG